MDYKPRQSYKGSSYTYKKKRIFWFNSAFNDDFTLINGKIDDITFNVPPFQTYKNNNLKLLTFVREDANAKPIIIKLKEPYLASRSVINTDKENYPIIYANHTGVEGMTSKGNNFDLTPQQIPKFVFKFDENFTPILSSSTGVAISQIFTYTGTIQTFNIPSGVSSVNIYCWGAGGGNSMCTQTAGSYIGSRGGNGGFVKATLAIPSGTTSLAIIVGQGGRKGVSNSLSGKAFGGGGDGISGNTDWYVGGGGGFSGVFVNDANMTIISSYQVNTSATPFIIAGAGGGGGGADSSTSSSITHGGNGGTDNGNDSSGSTIGGGGTQTTGGTGTVGNEGAKYRGGNGDNFSAGGGSGWYGGGTRDTPGGLVGGGGGGSSYINSSYTITNITNIKTTTNGTATAPANTESYYQSGIAVGAPTTTTTGGLANGGNGLVVIEYFVKRNDGITAGETLVQATNSSIAVVENSKYLINYENPTNIPTGTYETIFSNGSILFRNKKFPRPWGAYFAEDWSGTTLLDSSGNGRHATTAGTITKTSGFGNGANGNITYLTGTTASSINWPAGSIPSTFTILGLTRYNGATKQRILQSNYSGNNWLQGHWRNGENGISYRGSAYFMAWMTDNTKEFGYVDDWLCSICKNSGTIPNNILMDGVGRGIITGGTGGFGMSINGGVGTVEYSDWAMSVVLIWDTALSDAQMVELNRLIDDYKNTGRSIKNDLGLNFDYSYPILKDANGDTINPNLWYKFDTSSLGLNSGSYGSIYDLTGNTNVSQNLSDFTKGNSSASFNGSTSYLFLNSSPNMNGKDFTISFWEKKGANGISPSIFSIGDVSGLRQNIFIGYRSTNYMSFNFYDDDFTGSTLITSLTTWNFWTFTYNTTSRIAKIFLNGILDGQKTLGGSININQNRLWIGRYTNIHGTAYYNGIIDDLRMYEFELTSNQILELYNGRVSIYNPPNFEIGLEMNDVDLIVDNTISPYK